MLYNHRKINQIHFIIFILDSKRCDCGGTLKFPIFFFLMRFNMSEGQFIPSITFYYDTISPYSYLALELLRRYHKCYNFELILKPVYLQG